MGVLKLASTTTKTLDLGEGDFLEVREGISKRDFRYLLDKLPEDFDGDKGFTPGQADDFSTALFQMLVKGWSLPEEPTVENYLGLDRSAVVVVDTALVGHFNDLSPSQEERSKSKGNSK